MDKRKHQPSRRKPTPPPPDAEYLTAPEAAYVLRKDSVEALYSLLRRVVIPGMRRPTKGNGALLFNRKELIAWVEKSRAASLKGNQ